MQAKGAGTALTMHLSQHINRAAARRSLQNAFAPRALLRVKERCTSACTHSAPTFRAERRPERERLTDSTPRAGRRVRAGATT